MCAVRSVKFCVYFPADSADWWQIIKSGRVRRN